MFSQISEHEMDVFDRYSQGKMVGEELNQFKQKLNSDTSFRDNYKFYKIVVEKVQEEAALKETLKDRFKRIDKRSQRFTFRRIFFSSAAVLLIAVALYVFRYTESKNNYHQYLFEEPGLSIKMASNNTDKWSAFNESFANKEYESCIKVLSANLSNDTAVYYTGICYEQLNKEDLAIDLYSQLEASPNLLFRQKATYRKAVLMLGGSNREQGINSLKNIAANPNDPYSTNAKTAISKLND